MSVCMCLVQQGQISSKQRNALQLMLRSFSEINFGSAASIQWIEVAEGSGYTAGEASRTSFVSMTANEPLAPLHRAKLLRQLCTAWADEAQCTLDQILAVLADPK